MSDGETEFSEILLNSGVKVLNQPIKDIHLPEGMLITSIVRENSVIIPKGEDILREGDRIIVLATNRQVGNLKNYFFNKKKRWFI